MCDIKSVLSIKIIMSIRLFCGFYYKISSNKLVDVLVRAYCVFIATMLIVSDYLVTINYNFPVRARFGIQGALYAANVFINLLFSGENLFDFLKKIRKITPRLKLNEEIQLSRILFIFVLSGTLISHVLYGILTSTKPLHIFSASTLLAFTLDLSQQTSNFTRIIMFELLWHRMATLRKQLEKDLSIARRFEAGEEVLKKKLRSCMNSYKNLLNTTHNTDAPMKFTIFSSIVLLIPKSLNSIYLCMVFKRASIIAPVIAYEAFVDFIVTLSPALIAELINSEIDKMKLCVVKQLLVCKGVMTHEIIDDAMMYFRQRPFKYTIWRLFTMDMNMILSLIALLTIYAVAMVQFAHFFD